MTSSMVTEARSISLFYCYYRDLQHALEFDRKVPILVTL